MLGGCRWRKVALAVLVIQPSSPSLSLSIYHKTMFSGALEPVQICKVFF